MIGIDAFVSNLIEFDVNNKVTNAFMPIHNIKAIANLLVRKAEKLVKAILELISNKSSTPHLKLSTIC